MTQKQLDKIINFYKSGVYTLAMINAMHAAKKITDSEYEKILASKE